MSRLREWSGSLFLVSFSEKISCVSTVAVQADVVQVEAMAAAARHSGGISASVEE